MELEIQRYERTDNLGELIRLTSSSGSFPRKWNAQYRGPSYGKGRYVVTESKGGDYTVTGRAIDRTYMNESAIRSKPVAELLIYWGSGAHKIRPLEILDPGSPGPTYRPSRPF